VENILILRRKHTINGTGSAFFCGSVQIIFQHFPLLDMILENFMDVKYVLLLFLVRPKTKTPAPNGAGY
jgi:hypothetical protein